MFDVIVIGSGPSGSVTAKKCAEYGLKTLILEKKKLPREKVCSGILLSHLAQKLVENEFGKLPSEIVLQYLSGIILWVPGADQSKINFSMPISWRKDFDQWMNICACKAGVEIWDKAKLRNVVLRDSECLVQIEKECDIIELKAKYVVGADGSSSITRKTIFPNLKVIYTTALRECYSNRLGLEDNYAYMVYPRHRLRPNFWIIPRNNSFTLEGGLSKQKNLIKKLLIPYGLSEQYLLWRDACISRTLLSAYLFNGRFKPAKDKVLLVGDSAGLKVPLSGEGINTALMSGIIASKAILKAFKKGTKASENYIDGLSPILKSMKNWYNEMSNIEVKVNQRHSCLIEELTRAFDKSFKSTFLLDVVENLH